MYWRYEKRRPAPKAAEGATRKQYGTTWWGKQWLNALTQIDDNNRLPRGKTYANKGLVSQLAIDGATITAKVQGSNPRPYAIKIQTAPFSQAERHEIVRAVTENPLFLSKLLNRELPPELADTCNQKGVHIFPRKWKDMNASCSCPDYAVPCKHLAAAFYVLANEIDKNPFTVFNLRQFDLVAELQASGYTEGQVEDVPIPAIADLMQPESEHGTQGDSQWDDLDFSTIPNLRQDLFRLLSAKPVFYPEGDFKKSLETAYKNTAKLANDANIPVETTELATHLVRYAEQALILLDTETGAFGSAVLIDSHEEVIFDTADTATWLGLFLAPQWADAAPPLRALHYTIQLARVLVQQSAFVPQLLRSSAPKTYAVRYLPAIMNEQVAQAVAVAQKNQQAGSLLYDDGKKTFEPHPNDAANALLAMAMGHYMGQYQLAASPEHNFPNWFWGQRKMTFDTFDTRESPKAIQLWLNRFFIAQKDIVPVFAVEDLDGRFEVMIKVENRSKPLEAPVALKDLFQKTKYASMRLEVLRDLTAISEFFTPIERVVASKGVEQLIFDAQTFVAVFFEALPSIRLFGIKVILPKTLQKLARPSMGARIGASQKIASGGIMSLTNLMQFQWQIALGDQMMDADEFMKMVKKMRGIVKIADGYVYLDDKEVANILDKVANAGRPTGPQLLQAALGGEYEGMPIQLDENAMALIADLLRPESVPMPQGITATLRPYQRRGFEWMYKNTRLGIGSLIADDMGLGKTLQVITTLQALHNDGVLGKEAKALVVVPTTLLTNWTKELNRFAPGLRAHTFHGPQRTIAPLENAEILLTTYGVVRTETALLSKQHWAMVIIDEAQNIKNMETAQSKAVRKIPAEVRIAMSGTPVENRLSEYYSILEFANSGYLGKPKMFAEQYAKPIEVERNKAVAEVFRKATAPFLMRRLKSDKSIISDLPDKVEQNQYALLSETQTALYQNIVDNALKTLENSNETTPGIQRQGLVLKMLTTLKQVCNHPHHYLKKDHATPVESGKSQRLLELLDTIQESGEKTLIFTQFQEMGKLLADMIEKHLGQRPAFLHGGLSRKERDRMVDDFQQKHTEKILLLSLKAGGTGLNLTAANHVIHYDLWWNPAVEAQATDRAYRIGQQRNVQVHRFITQGTLEEKIDAMIQSKKELANLTVGTGEKWIGELSNAELRKLVALRE